MKLRKGMTLIELLIVLIIIGILGAVSLRAMDITRQRANFEKTLKSMQRLGNAIAGNPDLVADGRRTDFGFVGDMGRFPTDLDELRVNSTNNPSWQGPYIRIPFTGDIETFKTDAWGQEIQYLANQGQLISFGGGSVPINYQVIEDTNLLMWNSVTGTITDNEGNPPGDQAPTIHVRLWLTNPQNGQPVYFDTAPGSDGSYAFRPPSRRVPVGLHQLTVVRGSSGDSLTKWVTVTPRVGAIADFRFGGTLVGALRLINGSVAAMPGLGSADNLAFEVINTGNATVMLDTISFFHSDSTVFCESLLFGARPKWNWTPPLYLRAGSNDTMGFSELDSVAALARVRIDMRRFNTSRYAVPGDTAFLHGKTIKLKFNDGSYIDFVVP